MAGAGKGKIRKCTRAAGTSPVRTVHYGSETKKLTMNKRIALICLVLGMALPATAAKKEKVLLQIGGNRITLEEFMRIYDRNNSNIQDPENRKSVAEYLELYTNFKLKVLEAANLGMDTTRAFRDELAGYRSELAAPYLTDIQFNDSLVAETYRRMKREVNASHLMVSLSPEASPGDTLAAYNRISAIRSEILGGLDFKEAARKYSEDPSAAENQGLLGWFTVFQMVYPFERAAYSLGKEEVSLPVRTRFGYHLIRLNDVRDSQGEIQVAHIMKIYPEESTPEQKEQSRLALDSIRARVLAGEDFATLAAELSDDRQSAQNGGIMPWFTRGRMIREFSDPAFALEKDGDVSKPVDSGFGYHLIKRIALKPVPPFEEVETMIREQIKRDSERSSHSKQAFLNKLKEEYGFTEDGELIRSILEQSGPWLAAKEDVKRTVPDSSSVLFTFGGKSFTSGEWFQYLEKIVHTGSLNDPERLGNLFSSWQNELLMVYEDSRLGEKHPGFRSLLQEYHDGMLLFAISEDKIWKKASEDSLGLARFYETNKNKYLWPERFRGIVFGCPDAALKEEVEKYREAGIPPAEIRDLVKTEALRIEEGTWAKGENPVIDYHAWDGSKPADWNESTGFVEGALIGPEPKLLSEARGYHIADYQEYLEKEWIRELRAKYPVKINKKLLKKNDDG